MRIREEIENFEQSSLASYAMKSRDTAGRLNEEPTQSIRTCYQRDRDRIIHSQAFRKLEYKTQVFAIFEGDYYRTRLTHTIEVAQIARTIGRSLCLNEDLIEAIALAHDLGHPPFGHAGEAALNSIMQDYGLMFNHNVRSFEILTKYEKRYPGFDGLNLTEEVLVGILKHKTISNIPEHIKQYLNKGATLEAQVVDLADSLAYLSHDIDDGLTSGCICTEDLLENSLWNDVYEYVQKNSPINDKQVLKYQMVKNLINFQIQDLLTCSDEVLNNRNFQSSDDVKKFNLENPDKRFIVFSSKMFEQRTNLQKLLHEKLYNHYRVLRMTIKAQRIINDLFKVYAENPNQLPYSVYDKVYQYTEKQRQGIICHYIASMTDRFALDEYKKLFDPYQKV